MKKLLSSFALLILPLGIFAQQVPAKDKQVIDSYVRSITYTITEMVPMASVNKVFTGNFYNVKPGFTLKSGSMTCSEFHYNLRDGNLVELEELDQDKPLTVLPTLLQKSFLLNNATAAGIFETAINALYPVSDSDKGDLKRLKKGNQWIFIRGKFFEKFKAMIVTVDTKGMINSMEYSLDYENK